MNTNANTVAQSAGLRLYELPAAFAALYEAVDDSGEMTGQLEQQLAALDVNLGEKVNGICRLRQQWLREIEACESELERLKKRVQTKVNAEARIKRYLLDALTAIGLTHYETDLFKVRIQQNPPSVEWTRPVAELPLAFQRTEIKPDLAAAKAMLKDAGGDAVKAKLEGLPEGFEVKQGQHLRIS